MGSARRRSGGWRFSPPGLIASAVGADPIGGALAPNGPPPTTGYANRDSVEQALSLVPAYGRIAALLDAQARAIEFIAREPQSRGVTARPAATPHPHRAASRP